MKLLTLVGKFFHAMFRMWCHGCDMQYYGERRYFEVLAEQGIEYKLIPDKIIDRNKSRRR